MALDRFINWPRRRPSRKALERFIEDFISGAGSVRWHRDRWYVDLAGACSTALRRQPMATPCARRRFDDDPPWKRWIEVWPGRKCIDVMTRQHDEYTNAVAEGIAERIAGFWSGEREP